jgi:predicted GNAT family N-acyltransferase
MEMVFRRISTRDPEYAQELALRQAALREPLGLVLSAEDVRDDGERLHLLALDASGRAMGCVLVTLEGASARIRQMAVAEELRGRGLGRELMVRAEAIALEHGCVKVYLHARWEVHGFYEKLGYRVVSPLFLELEIPHVEMEK